MMTVTRIRPKADLIYGASGTRKTTQIGIIAEYVWAKYHKKTRMITLDGGGYDPLLSLVEAGIIVPWVLIGRKKLTTNVIDFAMQGYWPVDPDDPTSPLKSPTPATWEEFGYYAIEGLTSIGDSIMRLLKRDKAVLSQEPSYTYTEEAIEIDGKKTTVGYSGGNQTYYGYTQDQLYDMVMKTHVLPCEKVTWSGLEGKGEEEGTRAPVYGPAIVGRKSTGKATQWFGNSLHIEQLITEKHDEKTKQTEVVESPVMYTRTHAGKDKIPFPCKHRGPYQFAMEVPLIFDPPDMGKFYRLLDELNAKALEQVKKVAVAVAVPNQSGANGSTKVEEQESKVVAPTLTTPSTEAPKAPDQLKPLSPVASAAVAIVTPHQFVPPRITVKKPT